MHIRAGLELARINPDERQTAYERVRSDLESQTAERIALGRLARGFLARTGIGADHGVDVDRRGQESHHIIEQQLHALVLEGRTAEHRHDRHRDGRFADRGDQLVGSDRIGILEELLHQRIVGRRDFLDQLRAPFGRLGLHVFRNFAVGVVDQLGLLRIVVQNGPIIYKVYQPGKLVLGANRQNHRQRVGSETLLDLSANVQEVGARTVHLVDIAQTGYAVLVGLTPYGLRLGLDAAHGAERSHRSVQHAQRALHLGREVDVARGIDNIDLVGLVLVVPESGRRGRRDRDAALLLLNHPVHRRGAFVHLADLVSLASVEKNTFRGRRLTGIDVRHDADISRKS